MFKFSDAPGSFERHYIRQYNNQALFDIQDLSKQKLEEVQNRDAQDTMKFQEDLTVLVQKVIDLEEKAESQELLDLKSELEQSYTYACSLSGDQSKNKDALDKLIKIIVDTIYGQITNDALAIKEMDMEQEARETHFKMIENALIADLLRDLSPIAEDQLVSTLLSENIDSCYQCLSLFQDEQIISLIELGLEIEEKLSKKGLWTDQYQNNLGNMGEIIKNITLQ